MDSTLSTADLPLALYVDPVTFNAARAALAAGVTLDRDACRCSPSRSNCPPCLASTLRLIAPGKA